MNPPEFCIFANDPGINGGTAILAFEEMRT